MGRKKGRNIEKTEAEKILQSELIVEGKKREVKTKDGIKNNMYVTER